MKQKNYFIIFFILGIFWAGCNNNTLKNSNFQKIDYSKTKKKYFDNIYIVNLDTCLKYELPKTSFAIEYPSHYNLSRIPNEYFHLEICEDEIYRSLISISYSSSRNKNEVIEIYQKQDLQFSKSMKEKYQKISIEEKKIGKNIFYIFTSKVNSTHTYNNKIFSGDYLLVFIYCYSKYQNISNILISLTRKLNPNDSPTLNEEEIKILKSFRYVY